MRRLDKWWMRWYAVRAGYVEFGAFTRRGARRTIGDTPGIAVVRRSTWHQEH